MVERNFIHSLIVATNSTSGEVNGIRVAGGTTVYRNNMIAIGAGINNAIGTGSTTGGVNGINEPLGTDSFFHNSVYIGGSPTAGTGPSYAFNSSQTANTRSFRDNIFYNGRSNSGATGKNYIVRVGGTSANPAGLTINNNVYYSDGAGGVFGFFNSADVASLAAWKTAVGQDANSFFANPQYTAPTTATPDLHINPSVPSIVEGTGADVGVTNDFDGETRASLTPVDIGADAGNFTSAGDIIAPVVTYTALANTSSTGDRTLSVTVTDSVGVTAVRIYFKKSTDATFTLAASNACSITGGTATNGTYDCVISAAALGGVAAGETIQYFVVAQDAAGNLGSNPAGATGTSVTALTAFPSSPNSYLIVGTISGNKMVGAGGDYATLSAAIADLNTKELTGTLILTLTDAAYNIGTGETFPLTINANAGSSSSNTVTIKPATGVSPTISGSNAGCIVNLLGADWVTIDGSNAEGGTSRNLTITNTNAGTSSAVVCLQNTATPDGATNNTLKNTNIVGNTNTTTLFGIFSGSTTIGLSSTGNGNSGNTIQNNGVSKTQYGIFSQGASAANKNTGNTISQNSLDTASPNNIARGGIITGFENNLTVSENSVSGMVQTGSPDVYGISLGIQSLSNTTFTGNEVTNATVSRNIVGTVRNTGTFSACGICVAPATTGTNLLVNNMIYGVSANGTSGDFSVGMFIGGGAGTTTNIYFNSISMTGTQTGGGEESFALAIGGSNPVVDIRNNILYNTQDNGTGNNYAIGLGYNSPFTNLTSDYNDFFVTSPSAEHHVGGTGSTSVPTSQTTLSNWQTTTGRDANSKNVDPLFTSTTSLFLQFGSPMLDMGTPISGITIDIGGEARQTPPDIGADEITSSAGTFDFSPTAYSPNEGDGTTTLTVTRTGGSSALPVDVTYTLADGTATGGAACGGAVDYVNTGGTVSFGAGEISKTISVTLCDDMATESGETFTVTLTGATNSGAIGSNNVATVTIADNDAPPPSGTIQFNSTGYMGGEGDGFASLTVTRTGGSNGIVSATYSFTDGTATGGATCGGAVDYDNDGGTVTFADGDTADKTIQVPICDDSTDETSETFTTTLSGAAVGTPSSILVTISDNDKAQPGVIEFSMSDYTVGEADGTATITVNRTGGSDGTIAANYATSNGTATAGTCAGAVKRGGNLGIVTPDYESASGTITFEDGDTTPKTFNVPICEDTIDEPDETVNLALTPVNQLGDPQTTATLTITDNDAPPVTINVNDGVVAEPASGSRDLVFTITLSQAAAVNVSVDFQTVDGTAVSGTCGTAADYTSTSGSATFLPGERLKTVNVPVCADTVGGESDESFFVNLTNPIGAAIGDSQGVGTITQANPAGALIISEIRTSGPGGAGDDFVEIYNNSDSPHTVTASDSSAGYGIYKMGTDCFADPILIGTIPNGEIIPARGHYLLVGSAYTLGNYGGTGAAAGNLTMSSDIEDDRNVAVFTTSDIASLSSVNRLDGVGFGINVGGACNLLREGSPPLPAMSGSTLQYSFFRDQCAFVSPGCPLNGVKKDTNDNSADFIFADTLGTSIPGVGERLGAPGPENIFSPRSVNGGVQMSLLDSTVAANAAPNRVRDMTSDAPNNSTFGTYAFNRRFTNNTGTAITRLRFRIVDITTDAGPSSPFADLRARTSMAVVVNGINDPTTCSSTGTPTTPPCQVTAQATTLEQPPAQPAGGGFNSTLSATLPGGLAAGQSLNLNFLFGVEGNPNAPFRVCFVAESLPTGGSTTHCISEGFEPDTTVQFNSATYEVDEGDDTATVTVTRSGDTMSAVSVDYATVAGGTATGGSCQTVGSDYQTTSGTLNFASGETTKMFSFEICSDIQSENPPETVNLQLSNPTGGATIGTQGTATLNIIDAATQFRNSTSISIPEDLPPLADNLVGQASSSITVSGAGTNPFRVRVTLFGFTHPSPDDIDVLLVSPTGQKFVLVGDAGGSNAANNVTLTFEDAATAPLPNATTLASGNYKPANHEAVPDFFAPAPMGPYTEPGTTGTGASLNATFSGNPNGTWTLYLRDDTVNGNTGTLAGGFGLEFLAPTAASVAVSGRITRANGQGLPGVVVSLANGGVGGRRFAITSSFGYYTFEGVTAGDVYIISATSKRYTFNPSSHVITVQEDVTNLNFVAEQ